MRKKRNEAKSKNLHLGFYFGLLIFFIITVSIVFKVVETIKNSKFDGDNFFTVAVIADKNAQLISVSPKDSSLKKLTITGAGSADALREKGIPFDSVATAREGFNAGPKSYFTKVLFHRDGIKSNLTILDIVRLAFFASKSDSKNINEESVSINDDAQIRKYETTWFNDPQIIKEDLNIEVTNASEISGLGENTAKGISSMGGNVVLVNSSKEPENRSVIYYKDDSYTVEKLSKMLGIEAEKKDASSISDIVIIIGKDRGEL